MMVTRFVFCLSIAVLWGQTVGQKDFYKLTQVFTHFVN